MSQWYYSQDGRQVGPVELDQLRELVRSGAVNGAKELAWAPGMADWMPISRIPDLAAPAAAPPMAPMPVMPGPIENPYAVPASTWQAPEPAPDGERQEIVPGSQPLDPIACLKRAWEVMAANVGTVAAVFVVFFVISLAIGMVGGVMETVLGISAEIIGKEFVSGQKEVAVMLVLGNLALQIVLAVPSIWLALGLIRVVLNLVDGKPADLGLLFGGA